MTRTPQLRPAPASHGGFTLVEMLIALVILGLILAALTGLFVSGLRSEIDMSLRVEAQQDARLGLDQMRRELRCARSVSPIEPSAWPRDSITIELGAYCPTNTTGSMLRVNWCTLKIGSGERYQLRRRVDVPGTTCADAGARIVADRITKGTDLTVLPSSPLRTIINGQIFRGYSKTSGERASVRVAIPVNVKPATSTQWCGNGLMRCMTLRSEIVLRNTPR